MTVWPELKKNDKRLTVPQKYLGSSVPHHVSSVFADLKGEPSSESWLGSEIIHGENISLLHQEGDWAFVQSCRDKYVGWTQVSNTEKGFVAATHIVSVPRTFIYPQADMKTPRAGYLGLGSRVVIVDEKEVRGTHYMVLQNGQALIASHLLQIEQHENDYVGVAESLSKTPYLWGGSTAYGIDCSGLVQLAMRMAGIEVPRDSDMQAATVGTPFDANDDWSNIERGDLIFWRGHVGICQGIKDGEQYLIHANGYTMDVTSEPLKQAIARIEFLYEKPIGFRRPEKIGT